MTSLLLFFKSVNLQFTYSYMLYFYQTFSTLRTFKLLAVC